MSQLSTAQVKITLPEQLYFYLKSKADRLGLTMSSYIKNLIIDDVKGLDVPTFEMSEKREKISLKALRDFKKGKTTRIDSIDDYLKNL